MNDAITGRCGTVAIVGRPNVGKSTLLNRILGQKLAITSHKAQTTRHSILGVKSRAEGQILFVDTPGIHRRGESALNRYLNRTARAALADTDLILFVVEALRWTEEDEQALAAVARAGVECIAVINKVDRVEDKEALLPFLQTLGERHAFRELFPVSAARGSQVEALEQAVLAALPEGEPIFPEDQLTDRSERFFAAELLREQLTQRYGEELPYRTTVEIERFEAVDGRYMINALIWVERPGQKAIIIGKQGESLKATATQARLEMQKLFDCPVHLEVWVKIKKSWSSDEAALARLGYSED
ncbi:MULTISPECIES: GTPase Era [Marichromatium]|uniref:GTPase Era n=1 Tax=Marichromatium gracile TaxID=1048 RepID=A0A4R4A8M8_MARGR|nr:MULTISPECIES: GTPase Era [Marichromatium]MBK1708949.1 GTPase Era [Marichromatium gracile]RNE89234.1 GTPase Era [Marichromatium sp. AB31]RNE91385.1 GTPase Era [Marichromatium sp. AB32]TCW34889.1 GTP-binding protein Era [Marichromatium gracile]